MGVVNGLLYPFRRRRQVSLLRDRGTGRFKRDRRIQQEAAAEVAEVERDDQYFGKNAPANEDEL
jgi:hypothetical protein